ncbi:MAG: hypothetical protein ACRD0G_20605, partial [Acidimicrobiales bacterium]
GNDREQPSNAVAGTASQEHRTACRAGAGATVGGVVTRAHRVGGLRSPHVATMTAVSPAARLPRRRCELDRTSALQRSVAEHAAGRRWLADASTVDRVHAGYDDPSIGVDSDAYTASGGILVGTDGS